MTIPQPDRLDPGPFAHWIRTCGISKDRLIRIGLDPSYRERILRGEEAFISVVFVDKILSRAEWPLELVYPYEGELSHDGDDPPLPNVRRYARKLPDRASRDYEDGDSLRTIANRYGTTMSTVHAALTKAGVELRPIGGRHKPGSGALRLAVKNGSWEVVAIRAEQLQQEGLSYSKIAARLGYASASGAHKAVKRVRSRQAGIPVESGKPQEGPKNHG